MAPRYTSRNLHVQAREAEQAGEADTAADLYKQALKTDPLDDIAYNRLMVYHRRRKEYRKEKQLIEAAIAAHLKQAHTAQADWIRRNKKTARTAKALVKSLGLVDRKGAPKLETEILRKWRKRLTVVRKRLASQSKKAH